MSNTASLKKEYAERIAPALKPHEPIFPGIRTFFHDAELP